MWSAYALQSKKDGWLYVGMSSDVKGRLEQHNRGYNKSTKLRAPFDLFYVEECGSREEARKREKYLKSGQGREFLRERLAGSR
jgi:putative endonuclease